MLDADPVRRASPICTLDRTRIVPHLYQGSRPPTGDAVSRCGFDVLVLAAEEWQPQGAYPGVDVIHAPLDDSGRPMTEAEWNIARKTAAAVARRLQAGQRVLVTCMAGLNRSGLIVALTLYILSGKPGPEIVKFVQRRRVGALFNQQFVAAVSKLR